MIAERLNISLSRKINSLNQSLQVATTDAEKYLKFLSVACLVKDSLEYQPSEALKTFEQLFCLATKMPQIFTLLTNKVLEIVYVSIKIGHGEEVQGIIKSYGSSAELATVCLFTDLLYFVHTGQLDKANQIINEKQIDIEVLDRFQHLYKYHKILLQQLSGSYDVSLREYKELKDEIKSSDKVIPDIIYHTVNNQYINMLYMKGYFSAALKQINKNLKNESMEILNQVELLRIKGHIYRYNFMDNESFQAYSDALQLLPDGLYQSLRGELYNDLAELYCFTDPDKTFKCANESIKHIGENKIELGRTYAALSIASSFSENPKEAVAYAEKSILLQEGIGHPLGVFIGKISMFIADTLQKGRCPNSTLSEIIKLANELNVHYYALLPVFVLEEDKANIKMVRGKYNWIDFDSTIDNIKRCL